MKLPHPTRFPLLFHLAGRRQSTHTERTAHEPPSQQTASFNFIVQKQRREHFNIGGTALYQSQGRLLRVLSSIKAKDAHIRRFKKKKAPMFRCGDGWKRTFAHLDFGHFVNIKCAFAVGRETSAVRGKNVTAKQHEFTRIKTADYLQEKC